MYASDDPAPQGAYLLVQSCVCLLLFTPLFTPNDVLWQVVVCTMMNNELDMLHLQLEHMYDHVDHVIVVEAPLTLSGTRKPLHLQSNLHVRHAARLVVDAVAL